MLARVGLLNVVHNFTGMACNTLVMPRLPLLWDGIAAVLGAEAQIRKATVRPDEPPLVRGRRNP
jgi:carotenoid cleavage dioxygenase-like enzyme